MFQENLGWHPIKKLHVNINPHSSILKHIKGESLTDCTNICANMRSLLQRILTCDFCHLAISIGPLIFFTGSTNVWPSALSLDAELDSSIVKKKIRWWSSCHHWLMLILSFIMKIRTCLYLKHQKDTNLGIIWQTYTIPCSLAAS